VIAQIKVLADGVAILNNVWREMQVEPAELVVLVGNMDLVDVTQLAQEELVFAILVSAILEGRAWIVLSTLDVMVMPIPKINCLTLMPAEFATELTLPVLAVMEFHLD